MKKLVGVIFAAVVVLPARAEQGVLACLSRIVAMQGGLLEDHLREKADHKITLEPYMAAALVMCMVTTH